MEKENPPSSMVGEPKPKKEKKEVRFSETNQKSSQNDALQKNKNSNSNVKGGSSEKPADIDLIVKVEQVKQGKEKETELKKDVLKEANLNVSLAPRDEPKRSKEGHNKLSSGQDENVGAQKGSTMTILVKTEEMEVDGDLEMTVEAETSSGMKNEADKGTKGSDESISSDKVAEKKKEVSFLVLLSSGCPFQYCG